MKCFVKSDNLIKGFWGEGDGPCQVTMNSTGRRTDALISLEQREFNQRMWRLFEKFAFQTWLPTNSS